MRESAQRQRRHCDAFVISVDRDFVCKSKSVFNEQKTLNDQTQLRKRFETPWQKLCVEMNVNVFYNYVVKRLKYKSMFITQRQSSQPISAERKYSTPNI